MTKNNIIKPNIFLLLLIIVSLALLLDTHKVSAEESDLNEENEEESDLPNPYSYETYEEIMNAIENGDIDYLEFYKFTQGKQDITYEDYYKMVQSMQDVTYEDIYEYLYVKDRQDYLGVSTKKEDIFRDGDVTIIDGEGLLKDESKVDIDMQYFTKYGKAVFISTSKGYNYPNEIEKIYDKYVGLEESGMLVVIDTKSKRVLIYTDGAVYSVIKERYEDNITNNVNGLVEDKKYDEAVSEAFIEATRYMSGERAFKPMKLITSLLASICFAFIISFSLVKFNSRKLRSVRSEISTKSIFATVEEYDLVKHTRTVFPWENYENK